MSHGDEPLYPLKFVPIYKDKVWGGRRLERLGRSLPGPERRIGESWELADLPQTSVSSAGGGAERSIIANGSLAGLTLQAAWERLGSRLFPLPSDRRSERGVGAPRTFPLLVKLLDARENLSLQVHPDEAYVARHPEAFLKSEAWYVIDAEPGAVIYKGLREGVRPDEFRRAAEAQDAAALEPLLMRIPVRAGDCHYLPSGTCHSLGAGILVAEVQNPSDTTFRVFDWGRPGRELHLEQAMQCIRFGPCNASMYERRRESSHGGARLAELVECEDFRITRVVLEAGRALTLVSGRPAVWMVLEGECELESPGVEPVSARRGETLLVPAGLTGARARTQKTCTWLEVTFPRLGLSPASGDYGTA